MYREITHQRISSFLNSSRDTLLELLRSASSIMFFMSSSVSLVSPIFVRTYFRLSNVISPLLLPLRIEKLSRICYSAVMVNIILNWARSTLPWELKTLLLRWCRYCLRRITIWVYRCLMNWVRTACRVSIDGLTVFWHLYLFGQFAISVFVELVESQKNVFSLLFAKLIRH